MKIFLDIDGVMVHANPHQKVEFDNDGFYRFNIIAVQILNSVIHANGDDDELILSTSHRFRFTISEWKRIFKTRGVHTDNISILNLPLHNKNTRKTEIVNWVHKRNLHSEDIIIIDDDKSLNGLPENLKKRLVLTNPYTGLNNSVDLKKILGKEDFFDCQSFFERD
ncbi:HAD domain-containing protein [Flavobacterium sp. UBA4197]|uniref:HAD domain-containing protein n=1 Tax=Flavobacterium sp. UBA4197 TaxID=1946546 RepID=UPI00257B3C00|nr:HAD domain-containing protein [Flavobacterium sp. UBA4197]